MTGFSKPFIGKKLRKNLWEVFEPFTYHVGHKDSEETIIVPKGFKTDLASVPWLFRFIVAQDGTYTQGAVLHDYLYATKGYAGKYTRKQCDDIFLEAMDVLNVPTWKRHVMHKAVRSFGWIPWMIVQKRNKKG